MHIGKPNLARLIGTAKMECYLNKCYARNLLHVNYTNAAKNFSEFVFNRNCRINHDA